MKIGGNYQYAQPFIHKKSKTITFNGNLNSQSFQLLEYLFFNEGLPIYRTIENLHSSNANLYRLGRNITKTLSTQFQIELSFTPSEIRGNEIDIRYFFAQYFSERYYFLDWPFPDLPEEDLTEFADFFYKITNYTMRFSIYRMYKLMIAISIYRVKNGHFIDLPNHFFDEYYPLLMNIPNFEELLVHFSEKLGLEITPDIIAQTLWEVHVKNWLNTVKQLDSMTILNSWNT